MIAFDPDNIADDDTTFRVNTARTADLKSRALAAYFAPEEIEFYPCQPKQCQDGKQTTFYARVNNVSVLNRLDVVFGQECWSEEYEVITRPGQPAVYHYAVKCTIRAQFTTDGQWVCRSSVGTGTTEKEAHREAFERATVKYGVGRYTYDLPNFIAYYDGSTERPATRPEMPQTCIPSAYRWCGVQAARAMCDHFATVAEEAKISKEKHREGLFKLLGVYGYQPGCKLERIENRHARAVQEKVFVWMRDVAAGNVNPKSSPFYEPPAKEEPKTEQPKLEAPKSDKAHEDGRMQPKPKLAPPTTGAELIARIELKDEELSKTGRCDRGALKTHIVECGAKAGYSVDVTKWQGTAISNALKWGNEFIDALSEPKSTPQGKDSGKG